MRLLCESARILPGTARQTRGSSRPLIGAWARARAMEIRDTALGGGDTPGSGGLPQGPCGVLGVCVREGEDVQGHGLVTAWDGHKAAAESRAQPSCSVRVIKPLDRGSGKYVVKEGVSWNRRECARARSCANACEFGGWEC